MGVLMRQALRAVAIVAALTVGMWSRTAHAETIEGALAKAYENNPQLNAQRATVRQADEGVAQALSGYRPTINANANIGTQYTDTTVVVPAQPNAAGPAQGSAGNQNSTANFRGETTPRGVGLNLSQTLFDGLQTANRTRAAELQVSAARESLRVVEQSVLLSAAIVYMDLLRDLATVEVQRSNVNVLEQTFRESRGRFSAGDITNTDVAQVEAQLASAESTLHAARATLMATKSNYRRVIGVESSNLSPGAPVDRFSPRTLDAAVEQSLTQNPLVTAAAYGVDVALLQVKVAEGGLYPTMTLQGNVQQTYDQNILTPRLFSGSLVVGLSVPLYQGGKEYSVIRQNKEATGQQRFSLDQVRDQVRANVTQFWWQLDATKSQTEAAERQVRASESALTGVRGEARVGQRTTLDVLNAQQTLVNARVSLVTAQHDRVVASYNLLSAVGRLSPAVLHLPVQTYDPIDHYKQVRDSWFGVRTPDGR